MNSTIVIILVELFVNLCNVIIINELRTCVSMVDYYNRLEESGKYFACILRAIADNKSSPSFSNGRRKHLKPIALPFMLPS